jgi:hypothetical protein
MDCHDVVCKQLAERIGIMDLAKVGKIDKPIKMSQVSESDRVHFTASSGRVFVNTLLFNVGSFLYNGDH